MFNLPIGLAPLAASLPLTPNARFGASLLAAAVVTTSLLALAARRLTAPARASSAVVKEELSGASKVERTPLTGTPPAVLPDAQKLAALSTAADLFIGLLFALGLGVSGMLKPSKVAGEWGLGAVGLPFRLQGMLCDSSCQPLPASPCLPFSQQPFPPAVPLL